MQVDLEKRDAGDSDEQLAEFLTLNPKAPQNVKQLGKSEQCLILNKKLGVSRKLANKIKKEHNAAQVTVEPVRVKETE